MLQYHITLAPTTLAELDTLFYIQMNEEGNYLAAFTSPASAKRDSYIEKHSKFLSDPTIRQRTIKIGGKIAGSIAKFMMQGEAEITYWIDRNFWGKGVATAALKAFLLEEKTRPLCGRVAFDNYGSQKVLEHCGFVKTGTDRGFANARQQEIEEFIYHLPA